ncbi:MAG: hypothetical protein ACE5KR_03080 [Candidatus Bipolaricaulia bacterium]
MTEEEVRQEGKSEKSSVHLCCASGDGLAEAIERALAGREHVVMVRVNDEILNHLDMLVESGICRSRSCAATFMIREGIKANAPLFARISEVAEQIAALKEKLRGLVQHADEESG